MSLKRILLTGEQKRALFLPPQGAVLVKGVAGSGKTTVALYRAKFLLANYRNLFIEPKVVIFTYNKVLCKYITALRKTIEAYDRVTNAVNPVIPSGMNVQVENFHSWAFKFLHANNIYIGTRAVTNAEQHMFINEIKSNHSAQRVASKPLDFFIEEFSWIKGKLYLTGNEYIQNPRTGRGNADRIVAADKQVIWQMFSEYQQLLKNNFLYEFDDFAVECYQFLQNNPKVKPFTHIVVDEAQDLTKAELLVISSLVSDDTKSITIIADAAQRIYKSGFSWNELGLNIQGRSIEFKKNYRNTRQIAEVANSLLQNDPDRAQYTMGAAEREGSKPYIIKCSNSVVADEVIIKLLQKLGQTTKYGSTAILTPTKKSSKRILEKGKSVGLNISLLNRDEDYDFEGDITAVCTMQSIKGLEFDNIIIADLNDFLIPNHYNLTDDPDVDEDTISTARRLLFTSMTRACDNLILMTSGIPSRYLSEMDQSKIKIFQK
jgi:superfamily I DNA/RNA helicase